MPRRVRTIVQLCRVCFALFPILGFFFFFDKLTIGLVQVVAGSQVVISR